MSPVKLFGFILKRLYWEVLLLPVAGYLWAMALVVLSVRQLHDHGFLSTSLVAIIWTTLLFPLAIALEEFFHASACIGLGKLSKIHGLVLGRVYIGRHYVFFQFAGVDIRGPINIIDKLRISLAGPVMTALSLGAAYLILLSTGSMGSLRLSLLYMMSLPLIGLLPFNLHVASDGHAILGAMRYLRMPWRFLGFELARITQCTVGWLVRPAMDACDSFINETETYAGIEQALKTDDVAEAVRLYQKLSGIQPYNPTVLNNHAWLLATQGRVKEARQVAHRALRLASRDPDVLHTWRHIEGLQN